MKTLERFWTWFDGEAPMPEIARVKANVNLSGHAKTALEYAASHIEAHATGNFFGHRFSCVEWALEHYPAQLRDLSIAFCPAFERMHTQVPAYIEPVRDYEFILPAMRRVNGYTYTYDSTQIAQKMVADAHFPEVDGGDPD